MLKCKIQKLFIYCDGSSRGNPGPSAIGVMILDSGNNILHETSEYIGFGTNNQAEYKALIKSLSTCFINEE